MEQSHHNNEVTVEVFAPKEPAPKVFKWSLGLTVGAAAQQAAGVFNYSAPNLTLALGTTIFPPEETLGAANVRSGERLDLVSAGGGV